MPQKQTKIYFPNLNGLRFIAAFVVIFHHLAQFLSIFGQDSLWRNAIVVAIGGLGVEMFFVLSGFLITYLLLAEDFKTKTISIKDFYIRRILRIWPLYYLIGILAFFILPYFQIFALPNFESKLLENFNLSLLLYVFFLPNLLLFGFGIVVPYAAQSWSVGVEEQFYLIWPVLMKFFKNKLILLLSVVFIYFFVQFFGFKIIKTHIFWNHEMDLLKGFWSGFKIHCMAIGALFSYSLFYRKKILVFLLNKYFYRFSLVALIFSISFNIKLFFLYEILFGVIILNLASSEKKLSLLENNIMNYLGRISYGLYMYHGIAIVVCIKIFQHLNYLHNFYYLLLTVLLMSIFFASISYYLIEQKFILFKNRFSKVISGDNAKK